MLFSFGTWIWKTRGTLWVHHFPDALHQKSTKYLKCPDCTELLEHWDGTAALPNLILCPEKTKAGFKVTKMLIMAAQRGLVCLQKAEMRTPHSWDCNRMKVKAKEWWLSSLRQIAQSKIKEFRCPTEKLYKSQEAPKYLLSGWVRPPQLGHASTGYFTKDRVCLNFGVFWGHTAF